MGSSMEGVGLFTIANYRNCLATAIYVISDVHNEKSWDLGWGEINLDRLTSLQHDRIIYLITKNLIVNK